MAYIGRSFRRLEDSRLLTGQRSLVYDMNLPGLLYAVVLPYNNSLNRRQSSHGIREPSRY